MRIMMSCGEPSGDLYAGALAAELRQRSPDTEVTGFGGQRLAETGAVLTGRFDGLSVTGLTEALRVIPRSYAMLRRLVAAAREQLPDVLVVIDFPDFNFRLASAIRQLGIPIVYYVSPQLWAWRPGRMETMRRIADHVVVIFPFERAIYEEAGVPVSFVGHPLVDLARATQPRAAFLRNLQLVPDAPTVALLPGSRPNELQRLAPVMREALPLIRAQVPDVQFVVACAPSLPEGSFDDFRGLTLVRERTDDVLAAADVVITASGTATVQAALHERPMVVIYKLSPLTYRVGRRFVRVPRYAMPNLVAGREVVPELIQDDCTPENVARETVRFLLDRERYGAAREALRRVRGQLGESGATGRVADIVLEVAQRHLRGTSA